VKNKRGETEMSKDFDREHEPLLTDEEKKKRHTKQRQRLPQHQKKVFRWHRRCNPAKPKLTLRETRGDPEAVTFHYRQIKTNNQRQPPWDKV
jgi:hypothetical protein